MHETMVDRELGALCKIACQRHLQDLEVDAITKTVKQSPLKPPPSFEPFRKACGVHVALEAEANRRPSSASMMMYSSVDP